ncbi:hypothetical protein Z517_03638 [Fonsecaea pedrosoi CBS 271.37]|uniref:Unplaced genomic scaffold supercont1.2, whole genome shotgun sequence n=1 Tax=Fonsecaea pedrosoi CBS 271.37 TaxID=1442368 RepID=A0A0D2GTQ0_9EURO|nr:uncharacterized protein Z517_03638 [Fonsecaea pedrosoi CBS 271.37]KIW84388.1 hypothetical protein Z517_03638 [Fonsecaea pedrosoi CBS 271.37]
MPFLEISPSVRINYTIHQPSAPTEKPWVVLINGLADPQTTWAAQTPAFTGAGYTVLTYDNRGIGLSSRPESDDEVYTAETMAGDLRSLVTALKLHVPYHLMGVSMGGMIAQTYALAYGASGEIASLTLACTYAAPGPFCSRMFALWRDMAQRMSVADVMRDVALWAFTPACFAVDSVELVAMEADMARIDSDMGLRAYLAQLNVITTFDTRASLGRLGQITLDVKGGSGVEKLEGAAAAAAAAASKIKTQVIVLAGEGDILIPVYLSRELHAFIPGSRWRTTKGGHACMWEYPDQFNEACLEEWRDVDEKIGVARQGM